MHRGAVYSARPAAMSALRCCTYHGSCAYVYRQRSASSAARTFTRKVLRLAVLDAYAYLNLYHWRS